MVGQSFVSAWEEIKCHSILLHRGFFEEIKHVTPGFPQPSHGPLQEESIEESFI